MRHITSGNRRGSSTRRWTSVRPGHLAPLIAGVLLGALFLASTEARAQQRRLPAVPHASPVPADRLFVGIGSALAGGVENPVSGLSGDLIRLASVTVDYAFAPGAVVRVQGDALKILQVESRGPAAIPLDEGVADGRTHDAGDFRVATVFRLLGGADGPSGGLHLEVKLPNSDEARGIGLNTTDFHGSVFGSWSRGPLRVTSSLGVGILEAPLEAFVQDDVLLYGTEVLLRPSDAPYRLSLGAAGRANTRGVVPLGNEDRGAAILGADLFVGDWIADAGFALGYAGTSPDWEVRAGISRILSL